MAKSQQPLCSSNKVPGTCRPCVRITKKAKNLAQLVQTRIEIALKTTAILIAIKTTARSNVTRLLKQRFNQSLLLISERSQSSLNIRPTLVQRIKD